MMKYEERLVELIKRIQRNVVSHPILFKRKEPFIAALQRGESRLEKPTMATWNLTRKCNLQCLYCAVNADFGKPTTSSMTSQLVLDKLLSLELRYVSLLGGEPTLCVDLPIYINQLTDAGVFVDITTNGAKITPELLDALKQARARKLLSLMISLDASDPERNDSIRGRGSHETAIRASKLLRRNNIPFSIGMTISKFNIHDISSTYKYAKELGASSFCSWFVMPAGRATKALVTHPDDEYIRQVNQILDSVEAGSLPIGRMDLSYATVKVLRKHPAMSDGFDQVNAEFTSIIDCEGCKYRVLVDYNGDVYPCDFLQYPTFLLGNILKDDWQSIWNSPAACYKACLTRSTKPGCKDCPAFGCDTGCFGVSFANFLETGKILPMCEV